MSEEKCVKQKGQSAMKSGAPGSLELTFPIQIGNNEMKKWESSDRTENDTIGLVNNNVGPQFWQLERADEELLWSFHTREGGEKFYLTYNDGDPNDQNVRMHIVSDADDTKEKYFAASDTVSGKTLLSSRSSAERFLGIKDGVLSMVDMEEFTEDMEWIIGINLKKPSNVRCSQIIDYRTRNISWISSDSNVLDRIQVGIAEKQLWHIMYPSISTCRMKTFSEPNNFACQKPKSDAEIIFGDSQVAESSLTHYKKIRVKGGRVNQFYLQSQSSGWFVGKQQDASPQQYLEMKQQESKATVWTFQTANFVFFAKDGDSVTFPSLQGNL